MSQSQLRAQVPDGLAEAKLFLPDQGAGPWPLVLFYMDAGGLRPAMSEMAQRLADAGYAVLQPNLYWRSGPHAPIDMRTAFTDPAERVRVKALMDGFTKDQAVTDTLALLELAARDGRIEAARVGAVGYCMGGRMALVIASRLGERVAAAASIHGGGLVTAEQGSPHRGASNLRAALYIGVADADNSCTPEHQASLVQAFASANVRYEMELNPGARHGYAVGDSPAYDPAAAERHWERLFALLSAHLPRTAPSMRVRPPFIVSSSDIPERTHRYPNSDEPMGPSRSVGKAAGLLRIGVNLQRLPPGTRSSWPHAEEDEEEFVYVLEGEVDCWVDGALHRMVAGDFAAFPAQTGISHVFINNGTHEAKLLVGGEAGKAGSRILYPMHPSRKADMAWSQWWNDAPARPLGPHDGLPDALRARLRGESS